MTRQEIPLYTQIRMFLTSDVSVAGNVHGDVISSERFFDRVKDVNRNEDIDELFGVVGSIARHEEEQSYYLTYRYSTRNSSLVKTFLVCRRPKRGIHDNYTFIEFVQGGERLPALMREAEGIIVKLEK